MNEFLKKMKESLDNGDVSNLDEVKRMNKINELVETETYEKGSLDKILNTITPLDQSQMKNMMSIGEFEVKPNEDEIMLKDFAILLNAEYNCNKVKEELELLEKKANKVKEEFIDKYGEEELNRLKDLNII